MLFRSGLLLAISFRHAMVILSPIPPMIPIPPMGIMGIMAERLGWYPPKDCLGASATFLYYLEMRKVKAMGLVLAFFCAGSLAAQHHTQPAKHASRHAAKHQMMHHPTVHKAGHPAPSNLRAHPRAN